MSVEPGDHQIVAPQRKFKTAVVWDLQPKPWCWIGPEFAAECASIAASEPAPPPIERAQPRNRLRMLRVSKGLSQRALATLVGCSQMTVSDVERGFGSPEMLSRIRGALEG